MDLTKYSLNEIEQLFRDGRITEEQATSYLRLWNAGPHFTQAVISDNAIRNFDPENKNYITCYKHLFDKFGVRV